MRRLLRRTGGGLHRHHRNTFLQHLDLSTMRADSDCPKFKL